MAQRSHVPKFGNWESEGVPYTTYFEKARKDKSGVKMNPNDPQGNPHMFSSNTPPVQAPPFRVEASGADRSKYQQLRSREDVELKRLTDSSLHRNSVGQRKAMDFPPQRHGGARAPKHEAEVQAPNGPDAIRLKHEHQEDGDLRRATDSSLRHNIVGRRVGADSSLHRLGGVNSGDAPRRPLGQSAGSDRSIERSPLHLNHQAKIGNKGNGVPSPSRERRGSSESSSNGLAALTPGRSRLRSVNRGDDTSDNSAAVPKFGDWDETNPASAAGYTHIFNRVREERQQSEARGAPVTATPNSFSNGQKQHEKETSKRCCCLW